MTQIQALSDIILKTLPIEPYPAYCKLTYALQDYQVLKIMFHSAGHDTDAMDRAIKEVSTAVNRLKDESSKVHKEFVQRGIILHGSMETVFSENMPDLFVTQA